MKAIPDQIEMWDRKHGEGDHAMLRGQPSPLVELAEPSFPRHASILELGCGVGRDALYLAGKGHSVLATDGSEVVIDQNKERESADSIEFAVLDMQGGLPYVNGSFDGVYANLSMHYYTGEKTREIVTEITRVLKPGGVFAFACKSKDEHRTRHATEVETNVFVAPNGHALRLFSEAYTRRLLKDLLVIKHLDEVEEEYNGRVSSIVRCIARKESES